MACAHQYFRFVRYSAAYFSEASSVASGFLWSQSVEVQAGGGAEVGEAAVADGVCAVDECVGDSPVKCLPLQG